MNRERRERLRHVVDLAGERGRRLSSDSLEPEDPPDQAGLDHGQLLNGRVVREAREPARFGERLPQAAYFVDQPAIARLLTRPHAALSDRVDLLLPEVPALGDPREEHVVELVHLVIELRALLVGEGAEDRLGVRLGGGLVNLDADADLAQELAHVGLAVEDADAARDRERVRVDLRGG